MKVTLFDYTGKGSANPARSAAEVLAFTKSTRLTMSPDRLDVIKGWSDDELYAQLGYMARTLPSSWEFVHYSFLITGVTRAFTHQLVRTRTASYAQQALRVVDATGFTYDTGPTIEEKPNRHELYKGVMETIDVVYSELIGLGASVEDARGILPTNIHTNICMSANLRTVCDLVRKRTSPRVQGEYRGVLYGMVEAVLEVHPWAEIFFSRAHSNVARELNSKILELEETIGKTNVTDLIKLVDQLRAEAGEAEDA